MNLYSKARKHIDMNRVKKIREDNILRQIALQEKQYLLYFTQNTVPKYYDWRTGEFNVNPLSEINDTIEKRLEEIDDALLEGMTTKDFEYLYGGVITNDIVSLNPNLVSSTFAQDLISASGEVTSHMFGPDFPGSHINSIGDFDKPESLSKADINMMAVPTPAGDAIAWNPFDQTLPTNFQLGASTPLGDPQSNIAALDNTATRMVSRGETTSTHTDIYYSPDISQTDATITITRQVRTNDYIDYAALDSRDLMVLTGLWSVNNATKPMGLLSPQINDTNLEPMPFGYDAIPVDNTFPDENEDDGTPGDLMPMLRTYNDKSAGDVISFEWEFDAGTGHESNPTNADDGANSSSDDSAWVFINGSNTWYKLANLYDFDSHRIGDDDYYQDYNDDPPTWEGDSRQEDNAGRKEIRPQFRSGGSGKMSGSFSYTVQSGDIDSNGNLKVWIVNNQLSLFDRANVLKITNLTGTTSAADKKKQAAGQLGKTTDAFDLGYRVETPAELRKLLKGQDVDDFKIGVGNTNLTAGELKKVLKKDPKIANAIEKLGTQGKVFLDYLTGNLPDTIDNEYLGQAYANSIFQDAEINSKGTISVGDNIVGTGGKAKYDSKTGEVSIPFNYDFKTNTDEFKDPSKAGVSDFQKAILNAVGPYSADAQPNLPKALAPLQGAAGIIFGAAIAASKALGGAKHKSGKVTMSADKLEKINPVLHAQIVGLGGKKLKEQLYPGQPSPNGFPDTPPPKMAPNGYHPEFGRKADRYRRLDPISAKTMNMVGTDDPQTNKQVAAAAADSKPKKLPPGAVKKYAKRNVVKKESNNLYTRSRKYIDMNRVKELCEDKIKEQKIYAELERIEAEKPKHIDWRKELRG
tara:strand:- start:149 stop:2734 length:2586 start_codon:yes stop_codon:yes gene_type:complete